MLSLCKPRKEELEQRPNVAPDLNTSVEKQEGFEYLTKYLMTWKILNQGQLKPEEAQLGMLGWLASKGFKMHPAKQR